MSTNNPLFYLLSFILFMFLSDARRIPHHGTLTIRAQTNNTTPSPSGTLTIRAQTNNTTPSPSGSCPLNFTSLSDLVRSSNVKPSNDVDINCQYIIEGLRLVMSEYLRSTGSFHPPADTDESCWDAYEKLVDELIPGFKIMKTCKFQPEWISESCMGISTRSEFEKIVPQSALDDAVSNCNQSLENNSPCASCLTSLNTIQASYLTNRSISSGQISDCPNLPLIYAGAFINPFGPADPGTSECLFSLKPNSGGGGGGGLQHKILIAIVLVVGLVVLGSVIGGVIAFKRLKRKREENMRKRRWVGPDSESRLPSINDSTHLAKLTFDEIKMMTRKFHRDNLIGRGGYGNVYKGTMPDGSQVAIKRFKNCSAAGDTGFCHEVEVIASIRHVNLVEMRGYCVATTNLEGHQRIIVCDLMKNGSLHDHLFGEEGDKSKLTWPIRQKIALGMARGLAYLHYGAQPAIIHRDIKASNILLDDNFEAKVADFGLAKFNPEGFSHLSTRVAGTMGYVAPEYALYGTLTERSDVYSFGVVLLELLSGKKAILGMNEGNPSLLTDWAWTQVRKGHVLDVIEEGMVDLGPEQVMEKYVLLAVLCSHPQLYARPTMDEVVKIMETDLPVPSIPERPLPLIADLEDIERSASLSGSGQLSTSGGFQSYTTGTFASSTQDEHD